MSPKEMNRPLHAVADSGEVPTKGPQSLGQALAVIKRMEGELHGYRLRYDNLERELKNAQGEEAGAEDVNVVLEYHSRRVAEEGWWSRPPSFKPGSKRWRTVRAWLKDHPSVLDCHVATEGAVLQDRKSTKREWIDADSVFRNEVNFERAFERAKDPMLERVRSNLVEVPREVSTRDIEALFNRCDCGHFYFQHHAQMLHADPAIGLRSCARCDCENFDQSSQRGDQWLLEQAEHKRKGRKISDSAEAALEVYKDCMPKRAA